MTTEVIIRFARLISRREFSWSRDFLRLKKDHCLCLSPRGVLCELYRRDGNPSSWSTSHDQPEAMEFSVDGVIYLRQLPFKVATWAGMPDCVLVDGSLIELMSLTSTSPDRLSSAFKGTLLGGNHVKK